MISIIIPVKNDRNIGRAINLLNTIPHPEKIEIIVVDASRGNLDDIKKKFPKVKWIYFHNQTNKRYTFTEQINLGLKNSKGNLIAFIDADCIPNKNWLVELIKPIREDKEVYVTGNVLPIEGKSIHDKNWEKINKKTYRDEAGSANSLFKKEILKKIGYFDEQFEAGSDIDFSWRAIDAGYKIRYNSKAIIYDHWGTLKQEIKRSIKYSEARIKLYRKHPGRLKFITQYNREMYSVYAPLFTLYVCFIPLGLLISPYYLLFLLIPFIKNIKRNVSRKLIFDFFYGLGILKELFFPEKLVHNETPKPKQTKRAKN